MKVVSCKGNELVVLRGEKGEDSEVGTVASV